MLRCNLHRENAEHFGALKEKVNLLAKKAGFPVRVYSAMMDGYAGMSHEMQEASFNTSEFRRMVEGWEDLPAHVDTDAYYPYTVCMAQNLTGIGIDENGDLYTGSIGSVPFTNGVCRVSAGAGNTFVLSGIPYGFTCLFRQQLDQSLYNCLAV